MAAVSLRLLPTPALAPREATAFALAQPGTLIEVSSALCVGRCTLATSFVREAQAEGETSTWVMLDGSTPYGPDLLDAGIDPEALLVVRLPLAGGPHALVRAAEILLRSGGFGLVVLDLVTSVPRGSPAAWQGRLSGLAREHRARVVLLSSTPTEEASLGPLVTSRIEPHRRRTSNGFVLSLDPLKSKGGPRFEIVPSFHTPPDGL